MFGRSMLRHWLLDPEILYLNHGTVGAPPRRVLDAQQKLRDLIERQPSKFLLRELAGVRLGVNPPGLPRLRVAAAAVAEFLGAESKDLVFVDNATSGVNAVLHSLELGEGDEILIFDHAYGAVLNAAGYAARTHGAQLRSIEMPNTAKRPERITEAIEAHIGSRTRLAMIDHVVSENGLILPVAEIASRCHRHGVPVLVDGAHAPGAIPFNIESLGVDWYTGNLHKWAWSPRSSGILWTHPSRQPGLHHPVTSWGLDQGYVMEFDWPGTRDPTPHLAAPEGIAFMRELGVDAVQRYNHDLAWRAGVAMATHWKTELPGPESMIGTMVAVPLPERAGSTLDDATRLRDALLFEDNIEVHTYARGKRVHVRVSSQIYNEFSDVERLIQAIDRRL
jgi:isopenicillin-N epimerase